MRDAARIAKLQVDLSGLRLLYVLFGFLLRSERHAHQRRAFSADTAQAQI
jgi:hypothetical protein